MNPVRIITTQQNEYNPREDFISVSLGAGALQLIRDIGSLKKALALLERNYPDQLRMFKADLTPSRIKGSIYHELSHWLDDTFHNEHIRNALIAANERGDFKALTQGEADVGLTTYEINAQIHAIKQLKRNYSKVWNTITFDQMIDKSTALQVVENNLSPGDRIRWRKMILRRMAREGLLGDSMKRTE
jgi:hypothetical protein